MNLRKVRKDSRVPSRSFRGVAAMIVMTLLLVACSGNEASDTTQTGGTDTPAPSEVIRLNFSSHVPQGSAEMVISEWFMDRVTELTGGQVVFDRQFSAALVGGADVFAAIQDGVTQSGYHAAFYQPVEFPLSQVAGIPFITDDSEAFVRAFGKMFDENSAFQDEYIRNGVRPLVFLNLSSQSIGTAKRLQGFQDLEGLRLRAGGLTVNAINAVGGEAIALAANELYEALSRDVLDGWASVPMSTSQTFGLTEVRQYVHHFGAGQYVAVTWMISEDVWQSFTDDIRAAFLQARQEVVAFGTETTMAVDAQACDNVLADGAEVIVWEQSAMDAFRDEVQADIIEAWLSTVESAGTDRDAAQEFLDEFISSVRQFEAESNYQDGMRLCAARG